MASTVQRKDYRYAIYYIIIMNLHTFTYICVVQDVYYTLALCGALTVLQANIELRLQLTLIYCNVLMYTAASYY